MKDKQKYWLRYAGKKYKKMQPITDTDRKKQTYEKIQDLLVYS